MGKMLSLATWEFLAAVPRVTTGQDWKQGFRVTKALFTQGLHNIAATKALLYDTFVYLSTAL